ncbi:DUF2383 domain-containing protein [Caenorhabditis elegans]|uniref:DUF2383 domain-containing protein n=1 Tax=Caenorhabditis elegans TaxID=6239 RepID=A5A8R5_CAEEL|nr:DUF2383 domain-containing protein [Caenorhabditis elegans]CCD70055.1 DUF2383 domain-containing protein [Caenorhabditis elegans]|eukprot:NP_001122930.1 Uncharacterized protein CELE_F26D11.12 [Caenorhabditis elegans]
MLNNETTEQKVGTIIKSIKNSIDVFKKVTCLLENSEKDYLYTDDTNYKHLFDDCKKEHTIALANLESLKLILNKNSIGQRKEIDELKQLFNGFQIMISEVEVEQAVVYYIKEIDSNFEKLLNVLNVTE